MRNPLRILFISSLAILAMGIASCGDLLNGAGSSSGGASSSVSNLTVSNSTVTTNVILGVQTNIVIFSSNTYSNVVVTNLVPTNNNTSTNIVVLTNVITNAVLSTNVISVTNTNGLVSTNTNIGQILLTNYPVVTNAITNVGTNTTSSNAVVVNAPVDLVLSNFDLIQNGDIDNAIRSYSNSLSLYPYDSRMNFGYAVTIFFSLVSDPKLHEFLTSLGFGTLPASYGEIASAIRNGTFSMIYNGTLVVTNSATTTNSVTPDWNAIYAKNIGDYQKLVDDTLLSRINLALNALSIVESDPYFSARLNFRSAISNLVGATPPFNVTFEFDLTEIYAYDAALSLIGGLANFLNAHNVDLDMQKFGKMISNGGAGGRVAMLSNYYNPFGDLAYPNFARLQNGGSNRYATAKGLLIRAADRAGKGYDYLMAESDDQSDDIIPKIQPSWQSNIDLYRADVMDKFTRSMNGEYVAMAITNYWTNINNGYTYVTVPQTNIYVYAGFTNISYTSSAYSNTPGVSWTNIYTNIIGQTGVSLGRFFDRAPSIRDLFFELENNGEPALYDRKTLSTNSMYDASTGVKIDTPEAGKGYCIKLKDTTFGGLFAPDSLFNGGYTVPAYLPFVTGYNPNYPGWFNVMGLAERALAPTSTFSVSSTVAAHYIEKPSYSDVEGLLVYRSIGDSNNFQLLTNLVNTNYNVSTPLYGLSFGGPVLVYNNNNNASRYIYFYDPTNATTYYQVKSYNKWGTNVGSISTLYGAGSYYMSISPDYWNHGKVVVRWDVPQWSSNFRLYLGTNNTEMSLYTSLANPNLSGQYSYYLSVGYTVPDTNQGLYCQVIVDSIDGSSNVSPISFASKYTINFTSPSYLSVWSSSVNGGMSVNALNWTKASVPMWYNIYRSSDKASWSSVSSVYDGTFYSDSSWFYGTNWYYVSGYNSVGQLVTTTTNYYVR